MRQSFQPAAGCAICGREAELWDVIVTISGTGWAHLPCTAEGVKRWCRENRPAGGPLEWDRTQFPRWHASDSCDRALYVVREGGWARPALGWVMRSPADA